MAFQPEKIIPFHNFLKQDTFNRYESWKHCYEAFGNATKDNDYLALHLGFYLASCGMYSGLNRQQKVNCFRQLYIEYLKRN